MTDNDDTVNYPDPNWDEQNWGQMLDLTSLPDPPDDYHPIGYTKLLRWVGSRRPLKKDGLRWQRFYFWGIKYNWVTSSVAEMEIAFRKLLWYTAPHFQPRDWKEWDELSGDAGPRTIDYTKFPRNRPLATLRSQGLLFMPVSRHLATLPDPNDPLPADFQRPADAPAHWTDAMVNQSLQVVRISSTTGQPVLHRRRAAPPATPTNTNTNTATAAPGNNNNGSTPTGQVGTTVSGTGPHQGTIQEVEEAVERAIMKVAYSGLERHPDAAPRAPPREKTATTEADVLRSTISSTMANSHVRLRVDDLGQLFIDRGGVAWALKGRGPVYTNDSAVIDCMITAGKLLDAGSTNADRADALWEAPLNGVQRAFVELSDANWDLCSSEAGAQMKGAFVQMVRAFLPQFGDQIPDAVSTLWRMVAEHLGQFTLKFHQTTKPCRCSVGPSTSQTRQSCYISPQFEREDATGVVMQTLFERTFQARLVSRCAGCGEDGDVQERSFHPLPLRMAVTLDPRVSIIDHTKDISFGYRPTGEVEPNTYVTYRWLGGIYHNGGGAYRVFWNDTKRGELDKGRVCQYDPTLDGLIVSEESDVPPQGHRVPPEWWHNKSVPLLFYERVMNPSGDLLKTAMQTVQDMMYDNTLGVPTLARHDPWNTTEHTRPSRSGYPWQRLTVAQPPDAQRFHVADAPYAPGQATAAPPRASYGSDRNNDFTLPPLRSTNLLNSGLSEPYGPQPEGHTFGLPPIMGESESPSTRLLGVRDLARGVPSHGHIFRTEAPANTDEDVDMEM